MEAMRNRLLELLTKHGFKRGSFTLTSGRQSDFYIDVRSVALTSEGHWLLGRLLFDAALKITPLLNAVAGVELGGCPLASAVSYTSDLDRRLESWLVIGEQRPLLPAIYVRKKPKSHGTSKLVEAPYDVQEGARIVLLEDVVTSGGSTIKAVQALTEAGYKVQGVVVVVDRKEGGVQSIQETQQLPVRSLFTRYDFIPK